MDYRAPLDALKFSLNACAELGTDMAQGRAGDLTPEVLDGILEEAARFAESELAPQNRPGDMIGARFSEGTVTCPPGWRDIYAAWWQAGWNGVDLHTEWGGMGLPTRVATAVMELWTSANMAYAMNPVLGQGAADALHLHASEGIKARYLEKIVSGQWCATMNLTEPQAGSDLGALTTRAVPVGDGSYKLTGNKIFISYGEHDLSENIIHLVLARLPDAPEGTRGISLFVVPKFLVNDDGSLGPRNDVICTGIEHKLGIHASPTCSMAFGEKGGALGWLVGQPNKGLACMFTMMNKARLFTGLQGVALAERAYQQALAFARTRKQGRALGADASSLIIEHPDVRRNLATMRALTAASRAIAHQAALAIDHAHAGDSEASRAAAEERAGLLTPITKAYCTDIGMEVTSIGVQIHGGMGYVEETGAAQHFRDARIPPIYEGTNGIQAIDLVMRKVLRPGSILAEAMIDEFRLIAGKAAATALAPSGARLSETLDALASATQWLRANAQMPEKLLASATPYLRLFGIACASAFLLKGALIASEQVATGASTPVLHETIENARFYILNVATAASGLARVVIESEVPDSTAFH